MTIEEFVESFSKNLEDLAHQTVMGGCFYESDEDRNIRSKQADLIRDISSALRSSLNE